MPSQKQRRRRQKEQRHVYVYVDEEGNEVEPAALKKPAEKKASTGRVNAKGRPVRPIAPPTWTRAAKWAAFLSIGTFVLLASGKGGPKSAAPVAILYAFVSVPMIYLMHRFQYRAYVRMAEKRGQKP